MTKRLKKLLVAITIGVVLITAGIISGVCVINASLAKRPTYVSTAEELETAINDDVDKPIVLNNDIVVHGDLNANKLFDLEMNGHDLRVIGKMTLRTSKAGEMYLCDGKTAIKSREKVQADSVEIDAVNATVTWNANVQLKDGYTADDFVVAAADHSFIFNGIMLGAGGHATKTAMTVKQGRVVVAVKDEDVKAPAEIVVPAGANGVLVDNKTEDEVNIKASTSVSVSGNVSIDVDENAEDVKISAKTDSSKVTIKSGTVSSVDASGSEVIVDKGAVVDGKITAGKVENNGTVGEIEAGEIVDNSVAIYKEDKKNELDEYALAKGKDSYTSDNWTAVQLAVTAGKKAIDDAADIAAVDAAFAAAKAEIDKVKTAEQEAADALANKKTETLAALEAYAESKGEANYTAENWTAIQSAVTAGKTAIDKAADIAAVDAAFAEAKTAIDAIETVADSLEAYKTTQKAALEAYAESKGEANYTAENWTAIQSAVTAGKEAIAAAANETAVDAAYNAAVANIDAVKTIAQQLADKKAEVLQNLKAAYDGIDLTLYRETEKNAITAKYEEHKAAINAVTDIANLPGTFVTDFNAFVATQKTNAQLTAEELAAKKAEVIGKLDEAKARYAEADYRAAQWKNITDAYDNAKNGINAVTDIAKLPGNFVSNFTTVADAQPTAADLDEQELAAKKTEANQALENHYNSKKKSDYSDTDWDNITKFYNSGSETINSAETIAQVEKSLASAIAKMDEIKRSYLLAPEYNGGSGAQGESMRIYDDGKTYSLSEPEKENYVFMGWYTSSDFTEDTKVTHVTYESGIKKIYAKWGVMVDVQLPGVDTGYAVEPGKVFGDVFTDVGNFADMMGMGVPYGYYYVDTTGDIYKVESTDVNNFTEPVTVYAVFKVDNALYMYSGDMGNNHTLMVIGAVEVDGALTIKESIEYCDVMMPVTEIAKGAFVGATVTELRIPASVKEIGSTIFAANSTVVVYTNASEQEIAAWGEEWKTGSTVYTFDEYKADKRAALEAYGAGKGQDNYTAENWTAIQDAVTAGQNAIDNAADKTAVDAAFEAAKTEIDSVALAKARLDGTNYDSFAGALAALTTGEEHTLTLLADIEDTVATEYVFDGVNVTLDLNGHVLDGLAYGGSGATHYFKATNGAVLTITDSSEAKTGKITSWYAGNSALNVIYVENAKVVLNGGTITAHDANYGMVGIMAKANANVEINGGEVQGLYFKANRKRGYAIDVAAATATLTVNGGVLSTNDPSCYAIYNTASDSTVSVNGGTIAAMTFMKNTVVSITSGTFKSAVKPDYLTKGYACLKNEDGTYRVESGYVVTVGSVKYDTLSAAITAANTGDVITVYNDVTENEGNIKYIIRKALTISGAYGATGVKPVIKGTFAVDINGISDGSDVVTIENLEIVHNGIDHEDNFATDTKIGVVLQDGGLTLSNNYIHLVDPAPSVMTHSPSGLQLTRRGTSVSTGAITVSGNTFGAYPKYSDKTNTIATAIQVTRNYTRSGVLIYGELEVNDEKIYTGNKFENTDGNAQYVLYGNCDWSVPGYTYLVVGDILAYNSEVGDVAPGGKAIIARDITLTDKIYEIKAGTELVIGKGATLDCNGLTLKVNGTLTVNGEITNVTYSYGENGKKVVYLSTVNASTVFDPNAEYVFATASTKLEPIAIAASAKVKKMTINLNIGFSKVEINAPITVVSPVVINGIGVIRGTNATTKFEVTSDNAFIVKSGSLELNKVQMTHKSTTADTVKDFIKIDENANVAVTLNDVAFINTANNSLFINVVSGATLDLTFNNVTVNGTAVTAESEIVKR